MGRVGVSCKSERMQCYGFVWGGVNNGADPWILYPGKAPSGSQLDLWRLTSPYSLLWCWVSDRICVIGVRWDADDLLKKMRQWKMWFTALMNCRCNEWSESKSRWSIVHRPTWGWVHFQGSSPSHLYSVHSTVYGVLRTSDIHRKIKMAGPNPSSLYFSAQGAL